MEILNNILENLKEQLKTLWAAQAESQLVINIKEKYEELPPIAQKAITWAGVVLGAFIILWWPASNLMEAADINSRFEERRQALKDLLRIERDVASAPHVMVPPPPGALRGQFDQKFSMAGVKPEQIKEASDIPTTAVSGTEQKGIQFRVEKITIRQAIDLAYELERTEPSLKLAGFKLEAHPEDPHFYDTTFKIVNFSPKLAQVTNSLLDAVKPGPKKKSKDEP